MITSIQQEIQKLCTRKYQQQRAICCSGDAQKCYCRPCTCSYHKDFSCLNTTSFTCTASMLLYTHTSNHTFGQCCLYHVLRLARTCFSKFHNSPNHQIKILTYFFHYTIHYILFSVSNQNKNFLSSEIGKVPMENE